MTVKQQNTRNFSIIAHIDHGKSTLADRILEETGAITEREKQEQLLDSMDIERERGITIKLNTVQLKYNYEGEDYILHLIDTPGHVDFTYEVSRSLAACEGAILVVDAAQGIEAQTLANLYLAMENDLTIIPVINKIDLPNANIEKVKKELMDSLGFSEDEIILCSAKNGIGIKELVEAVITRVKPPKGNKNDKLQALIFDSYFDSYRGIVTLIRIVNGSVKVGDKIKMFATDTVYDVVELGVHNPKIQKKNELTTGEVGYLCASIKKIGDVKVGDTVRIITGKDKGKEGKILRTLKNENKVVVEGLNIVKRHSKPRNTNESGGIFEIEAPIHVSNVKVLSKEDLKASKKESKTKAKEEKIEAKVEQKEDQKTSKKASK